MYVCAYINIYIYTVYTLYQILTKSDQPFQMKYALVININQNKTIK